jgi:plasmid maintenance system antidote protein VapI
VILRTNIKFVRIDEEGNAIPISDRAKNRISKIINGETDITDKII